MKFLLCSFSLCQLSIATNLWQDCTFLGTKSSLSSRPQILYKRAQHGRSRSISPLRDQSPPRKKIVALPTAYKRVDYGKPRPPEAEAKRAEILERRKRQQFGKASQHNRMRLDAAGNSPKEPRLGSEPGSQERSRDSPSASEASLSIPALAKPSSSKPPLSRPPRSRSSLSGSPQSKSNTDHTHPRAKDVKGIPSNLSRLRLEPTARRLEQLHDIANEIDYKDESLGSYFRDDPLKSASESQERLSLSRG